MEKFGKNIEVFFLEKIWEMEEKEKRRRKEWYLVLFLVLGEQTKQEVQNFITSVHQIKAVLKSIYKRHRLPN